jgi:hypothetical protein
LESYEVREFQSSDVEQIPFFKLASHLLRNV